MATHKKGSAAAKAFMAKLRSMKKQAKVGTGGRQKSDARDKAGFPTTKTWYNKSIAEKKWFAQKHPLSLDSSDFKKFGKEFYSEGEYERIFKLIKDRENAKYEVSRAKAAQTLYKKSKVSGYEKTVRRGKTTNVVYKRISGIDNEYHFPAYILTIWDGKGSGVQKGSWKSLKDAKAHTQHTLSYNEALKKYGQIHFQGSDVACSTIDFYKTKKSFLMHNPTKTTNLY